MSREEWKANEAVKWIREMRKNKKYDSTYQSVKSNVLQLWLRKTFSGISINEAKPYFLKVKNL